MSGVAGVLRAIRETLTDEDFPFFNRHPHHSTSETWAMWAQRDVLALLDGEIKRAEAAEAEPREAPGVEMRRRAHEWAAERFREPGHHSLGEVLEEAFAAGWRAAAAELSAPEEPDRDDPVSYEDRERAALSAIAEVADLRRAYHTDASFFHGVNIGIKAVLGGVAAVSVEEAARQEERQEIDPQAWHEAVSGEQPRVSVFTTAEPDLVARLNALEGTPLGRAEVVIVKILRILAERVEQLEIMERSGR